MVTLRLLSGLADIVLWPLHFTQELEVVCLGVGHACLQHLPLQLPFALVVCLCFLGFGQPCHLIEGAAQLEVLYLHALQAEGSGGGQ